MSDPIRRAIRAFVQTFISTFISLNVISAIGETGIVDWASLKKAVICAAASGITSFLVFVQNWLEDNTQFPALLKATASSGQNPVTLDPPK